MSGTAHFFVAAVTLLLVVWVVLSVRRHRLKGKYSLLWLGLSAVLLAVAAVPDSFDRLSDALGIDYPPATFLFLSVAFLLVVVVHFSWELSRLEERSRVMAEEAALLRAEQERLVELLARTATATPPPSPPRPGAPSPPRPRPGSG